jgi:hypothetical protein
MNFWIKIHYQICKSLQNFYCIFITQSLQNHHTNHSIKQNIIKGNNFLFKIMGNEDRENTGNWGTTYSEDWRGSRRAEDWTLKKKLLMLGKKGYRCPCWWRVKTEEGVVDDGNKEREAKSCCLLMKKTELWSLKIVAACRCWWRLRRKSWAIKSSISKIVSLEFGD